jgi:hypothetical protein
MPLMPDSKVARDRYHVCLKTLSRWDEKPELKFPAAEVINGRKYRCTDKLDAWDAARALTEPVKPTPRGVAAKPANSAKSSAPVPPGKTADAAMHAETEAA